MKHKDIVHVAILRGTDFKRANRCGGVKNIGVAFIHRQHEVMFAGKGNDAFQIIRRCD